MKKLISVIVALLLMLALAGCSKNDTAPTDAEAESADSYETVVESDESEDADAAEDEARNDFVQAQPRELFPDDNGHRTDNHPRQRAVTGHT